MSYDAYNVPDSEVYGAYMGPTWGRQDPGGPHVGPMDLAISGFKSPVMILLVQQFVKVNNKDNTKAPYHWPFC